MKRTAATPLPDFYRWVIVLGGILGLLAALGIGRFSLGMMLPAMGQGLGLSYTQMGVVSTVNFCGYLAAVLLCGRFVAVCGARLLISSALLLIALSMGVIGFVESYFLILVLYCLTGVGSALANIPIMAVVASWFEKKNRGRAAGLCVMGNGIGILLSGRLVPYINQDIGNWRLSWLVLAMVAGFIAVFCLLIFRERPRPPEAGWSTVGGRGAATVQRTNQRTNGAVFVHCGVIYFLYGFSYVVYVTFLVTSLVQDHHFSEAEAGSVWSAIGLVSLVSGPFFGYLSDRLGRKAGLLIVFSLQLGAYLLLAIPSGNWGIYCSCCLFALSVWAIPTIMAALVGDLAGPERTAAVFGSITFLFGIGQIGGPVVAGFLAEQSGSFASSYLMIAGVTGLAILFTWFLDVKRGAAPVCLRAVKGQAK